MRAFCSAVRASFAALRRAIAAVRSPSTSSPPAINVAPALRSSGGVNALRNAPGVLTSRVKSRAIGRARQGRAVPQAHGEVAAERVPEDGLEKRGRTGDHDASVVCARAQARAPRCRRPSCR